MAGESTSNYSALEIRPVEGKANAALVFFSAPMYDQTIKALKKEM